MSHEDCGCGEAAGCDSVGPAMRQTHNTLFTWLNRFSLKPSVCSFVVWAWHSCPLFSRFHQTVGKLVESFRNDMEKIVVNSQLGRFVHLPTAPLRPVVRLTWDSPQTPIFCSGLRGYRWSNRFLGHVRTVAGRDLHLGIRLACLILSLALWLSW